MNASPSRAALRRKLVVLALVLAALVALALAWSWSPLKQWLDVDAIVMLLQRLGQTYGPVAAAVAFGAALTLAVPLSFLTVVILVALGPMVGVACAMAGALLGAAASYGLGHLLGREVMHQLGGARMNAVSERLARRGVLAVAAVRLVPIAPFAVVNMVAGATHIRLRDLLLGTALGMLPGTLGMVIFLDPIIATLRQPNQTSVVILLLIVALISVGLWGLRRWLKHTETS
jgi:uncharacterized membrane protein YdjX (TVP38/TMEM64 family)